MTRLRTPGKRQASKIVDLVMSVSFPEYSFRVVTDPNQCSAVSREGQPEMISERCSKYASVGQDTQTELPAIHLARACAGLCP